MAQRKKAKADYHAETDEKHGIKFLLIEDLNAGNASVTNDIENVVADIEAEGTDTVDHVILYADSEGNWDGWSKTKGFFPVGGGNARQAMMNYSKKIEN